jgi:spermidine/putrescine transport system permease protein
MASEIALESNTESSDISRIETITEQNRRRTALRRWIMLGPALAVILICGLMPLVIILFYSLMRPADFAGVVCCKLVPDAWINLFFEQDIFSDALTPNYAYYTIFTRSIALALLTTGLALGVGFPTAFVIATQPRKRQTLLLFLITIPFWTNLLIRTYSIIMVLQDQGMVNKILMDLGLIDHPLQLMYTNIAIGYGLAYAYLPYMVLPLYASIERLDFRLVEAGYDLYGNRLRVLWHVIIPLVKPGIVAGCILVFIPAIGDYVITTQLGGGTTMMLGSLISQQFLTARNWPQGSALSLGLMLVVMIALVVYVKKAAARDQA